MFHRDIGDATMHNKLPLLSPLALAVSCALGPAPSLANPTGAQVVSGSVSINAAPGVTTINQNSHRAIVNWQSFSIQPGETTRFNQPSSSAAILNRVVSGNPSQLLGNLSANGQVFLINPNGVLVGAGATINTGAFVAATRDVSNTQFMQGGPLDFTGTSGAAITNLGNIHAAQGDVQLIAYTVDNQGSLSAPRGTAGLASGTHVLFAPADSQRILVRPDAVNTGGSVANSGVISAAQVELKAAGGNPYALAINAGGSISAVSIDNVGGRIILNAKSGTTQVDGALAARNGDRGGSIEVTGQHVRLTGQASLDASGSAGGGTIHVGGGYQGKEAQLQNAESLTVAAGARLNADAGTQGDGGRIILWSDGHTAYQGHLSARGGSAGGDGGFAEISGKKTLDYRGSIDLRAPAGKAGTLLLDPTDITLISAAATGNLNVSGNTSTITDADLAAALAGGNVIISTASGGSGSGDITVSAVTDNMATSFIGYFFDSTPNALTLLAERDIIVNHPLRVFSPGSPTTGLTLQAGRNLQVNNSNTFLWSNNLTLVADNANNGNGTSTMGFASGVMLFGDNIRLFVPSTDQLTRPSSVTLTNLVPNVGLWLGDPGTTAEGIYTRRAGTASSNPGSSNPGGLNPGQVISAATIYISGTPLDELIRATGDAELIKQLELFNALKEFVARDGISDGEAREIRKAEEALRNRLPDFDPSRQQRIDEVGRRNDPELTRWMDTLLWFEQYIIKYGRDEYTLAEIAKLKQQIDIKLAGYGFVEQIQAVNSTGFQSLGFSATEMIALFQTLANPDYPTLRQHATNFGRAMRGDPSYVSKATDAELRGMLFDQLFSGIAGMIDTIDRKAANQLQSSAKNKALLDEANAQLEGSGFSSSSKQVINLGMMWDIPKAQRYSNFYNERLQEISADLAVFATQRAVLTDLLNRVSAAKQFLTGQAPKPGNFVNLL